MMNDLTMDKSIYDINLGYGKKVNVNFECYLWYRYDKSHSQSASRTVVLLI
jgi:hypothetical protein